uniref:Uncharacterized protein n=1 Tax=Clandestinovirus TaxID=2831644 RepID=A0A8F8KPX5_9VIRU|nr:hypothetical protein KOM_12_372 [Clandestinovirus]
MSVPKEIIAIIHTKADRQNAETLMILEQFVIPYLYHIRAIRREPHCRRVGNLVLNSNRLKRRYCARTKGVLESAFTLTALKRVCKQFRRDVSYGMREYWYTVRSDLYFSRKNKINPFVCH